MLQLKNLCENYPLARLALTHWAHEEAGLEELLSRFRISANAVYPFWQEGRLCFLRLAPTEEKQKDRLLAELDYLSYLQTAGFPTAAPLPSLDRNRLLTLHTGWGDWYAQAFAGVPGTRLDRLEPDTEKLALCGQTLGRLHALSAQYPPDPRVRDVWKALDWAALQLNACGAPAVMSFRLASLRARLKSLPREDFGLIHYDFEPDNLFYQQETGQIWVIDFEDQMYHWYAMDLWRALEALKELLSGPALSNGQAAFLEGYRRSLPLPRRLKEQFPLMEEFSRLYGYARLLYSTADPPACQPDWMKELLARLQEKIRQEERSDPAY